MSGIPFPPPSQSSSTGISKPRDVQTATIASHTLVLRSRTWERLKFEVEYARQRGTTSNSYLIQAKRTALIDPPGGSFTQIYLQALQQHLDCSTLDYVILGHVNSNRLTTLTTLLAQAPQARLVCTRPAVKTLKASLPGLANRICTVRPETILDLGQGHQLQFVAVPSPRWPDGLCTYDAKTRILFSDKFFGVHLCGDTLFDDNWKQLDEDRRYYFDCLHAPQAKQVEAALDKLAHLPAHCYAPGHGPLVRYSLSRLHHDYRQWCQQQVTQDLRVTLLYASAYGNTATLARAIAQGLIQAGVAVELINCELTDPDEMTRTIERCDGFIIGSPTLGGHAPVQIQTALGIVLSTAAKTKLAGVFGSYGWSGEALDLIEGKLRDANYSLGFETIRVRFSPTSAVLQQCEAAGVTFAQCLRKTKRLRTPHQAVTAAQVNRTEQAVGRIVGSLCVVTSRRGQAHSGLLTSWVSQATFSPPGLMLAIADDQNADTLLDPGSPFTLNILAEGRNLRRHFHPTVHPGENPFIQLPVRTATNGCLILNDALAYLECTVHSRMACSDRWLVYAAVNQGEVLEPKGVTAIQHRRSGSHY